MALTERRRVASAASSNYELNGQQTHITLRQQGRIASTEVHFGGLEPTNEFPLRWCLWINGQPLVLTNRALLRGPHHGAIAAFCIEHFDVLPDVIERWRWRSLLESLLAGRVRDAH